MSEPNSPYSSFYNGQAYACILCLTAAAGTELADAYSSDTVIASSPRKEVHDPWAFYLHAALLRQQGSILFNAGIPTTAASAPTVSSDVEDVELAMAINASIQSALVEGVTPLQGVRPLPQPQSTNGWGAPDRTTYGGWVSQTEPSSSSKTSNGWMNEPTEDSYNGWSVPESGPSTSSGPVHEKDNNLPIINPCTQETPATSVPSAPPIATTFEDGPIHYPSIDFSPVELKSSDVGSRQDVNGAKDETSGSSTCIICLDSPIEGACIPCGHMAGCMSCLNEVKKKDWGCPVCRANIDQVVKLYAV